MKYFTFKIICAGDGGVGKTTLLHKYVEDKFLSNYQITIGVDILSKEIMIDKKFSCALQLWDFGGQDRFRFFQESFVLGTQGALLLFDLSRGQKSLESLDKWVKVVRKFDPMLPIVLLGSKADLVKNDFIYHEFTKDFREKYQIVDYLKISSLTGLNVDEAFKILIKELIKKSSPATFSNDGKATAI